MTLQTQLRRSVPVMEDYLHGLGFEATPEIVAAFLMMEDASIRKLIFKMLKTEIEQLKVK